MYELDSPEAFLAIHGENNVVEASVNQRLPNSLFHVELVDGVTVATDWHYDPPIRYTYRKDQTEAERVALCEAERAKQAEGQKELKKREAAIANRMGQAPPPLPEKGWLNGDPMSWNQLRGKVVVLHFWDVGCGPCMNELPFLAKWHEDSADTGVVVIGIHRPTTDLAAVRKKLAEFGAKYPVVIDLPATKPGGLGLLQDWFGVSMWPYTVLIDKGGKVAGHGRVWMGDIAEQVRRLSVAENSGAGTPVPDVAVPKHATEQAKAIAEIEKLGGKVTVDKKSPDKPAIRVDLQGSEVTDAGLEHLKGLTELQTLDLWRTKLTGAGLVHLRGLTKLQLLEMSETKVTDAGLEHLKALTRLEALSLGSTKVTDAGLEHLKGLTQLQSLNLFNTQVTDAGLERLKGLTQLQRLELGDTQVTDAGLEHIKGLSQLQSLTIFSTQVTDKGLEHLQGLTQLQMLHLARTRVTDAGLGHLEGLTKLQTLYLGDTQVTGVGLRHLEGLTNLETLGLDDTQVSDAGLEHLEKLTKLQFLNLCGTRVTDAGLVHLKSLTKLEQVYLGHTKVTDAGLEHLKGLTQLRILDLSETGVTDEGVKRLQQALPNCEIKRDIPSSR